VFGSFFAVGVTTLAADDDAEHDILDSTVDELLWSVVFESDSIAKSFNDFPALAGFVAPSSKDALGETCALLSPNLDEGSGSFTCEWTLDSVAGPLLRRGVWKASRGGGVPSNRSRDGAKGRAPPRLSVRPFHFSTTRESAGGCTQSL